MSVSMQLPERRRAGTLIDRSMARGAVAAAHVIARLPPTRMRTVLSLLAARARPAPATTVTHAHSLVVAVSSYCAGWRGCLPRAIAVGLICRCSGTWPEWAAGVRATPPFAAHAWVVADGAIVGEPGGSTAFRALMRVPPGRSTAPELR